MASETPQRSKKKYIAVIFMLMVLLALWGCLKVGRVLTGQASWGPKIGGKLPNGTEVYFQSRPAGFETDDRLTVVAPNTAPKHHWVDQEHGGFAHVALKYNNTGTQLWVESDGKVGASIDLMNGDFRAETEIQHKWANYGTGTTLDSGDTASSFLSL